MQGSHNPFLSQIEDGRWIVACPQCQRGIESIPVGIGLPIETREMAELLRENHAGAGRRGSRSGDRLSA